MTERATIAVAGAGIGGLTAALHLARAGFDVIVIERARVLREVGAGLQISSNASRVLIDLGLGNELAKVAVAPERLRLFSARSGRELNHIDFGTDADAKYGAPYWVIHRADLHQVLADAAATDPRIDIRLNQTLENADDNGDNVKIALNDGNQATTLTVDALIGADGVWSTVRDKVLGFAGAQYSGRASWRATLPIDAVPADFKKSSAVWFGDNAHLVHYPIHAGREFNIVAITVDHWREEGWSAPGERNTILSAFSNWPERARALIAMPDQWLKWALCGMPTGKPWHRGRVALLGDAAHAMLPFAAQGAAMAIEDAAILARALTTGSNIEDAFSRYEARRRPRVERVVETARDNDRIYHLSGLPALARDKGIQLLSPQTLMSRYDWIYGWKMDNRKVA